MHCSKQKYKFLKSAMVCLLMGTAFVSTDGLLFAAHSADTVEKEDISAVGRIKSIEGKIAKKHEDWVYKPVEYNTSESTSSTRTFGRVLREVADKMKTLEDVNHFLTALDGEDTNHFFNKLFEIVDFYFDDGAKKIGKNEDELLDMIARDFYAVKAFMNLAECGLSYKYAIAFVDTKNKTEYEVAKDTQTSVVQAATQEKETAIRAAEETFAKVKSEAEETYKNLTSKKQDTISFLEEENKKQPKSRVDSSLVSSNKEKIEKLRKECATATNERDEAIKKAEKVLAEAKINAEKAFNEVKVKQEELVKKAKAQYDTGSADLKKEFSWYVEPLGSGYGGKTLARYVSGKPQDRGSYAYHKFNVMLSENESIRRNARLDLVSSIISRESATEDMLYLLGITKSDLQGIKQRNLELQERLASQLSSVSLSEGKAQKKSAKSK